MSEGSESPILLIERSGNGEHNFAEALGKKGYHIKLVSTGQSAIDYAQKDSPTLLILNAASLGSSGLRIASQLHDSFADIPLIHIMPEGTPSETQKRATADIVLVLPFTARKLINRIKRLTHDASTDKVEVAGFEYVPTINVVRSNGKEKRLTPKAASLLELFIKHPGETLDRGFLMQKVWHTDYVGDTRTLDVHIRWVREAIEKNPAKPKLLITMRGKGYCFRPDGTAPPKPSKKSKKPQNNSAKK